MILNSYNYCPLLKTTDAELKAYENLPEEVKNNILPIFELTKSRRSKKNPHGNLQRRIDQLKELIQERPFLLDLTTETTLSNKEIDNLLKNTRNGYAAWRDFLQEIDLPSVIPVVHYNEEATDKENLDQVKNLEATFKKVAFRADAYDSNMMNYFEKILNGLSDSRNMMVIMDVKFVSAGNLEKTIDSLFNRIRELRSYKPVNAIISMASSFPKSVVSPGYGGDDYGDFKILEINISESLKKEFGSNIYHGDYGSVHPVRYLMGGGGWIPRVDVPLEREYFYYRFRREAGGYIKAAQKVLQNAKYKKVTNLNIWGDEEITCAGRGEPNGKSPSHWIAVRLNRHITQQYIRLQNE